MCVSISLFAPVQLSSHNQDNVTWDEQSSLQGGGGGPSDLNFFLKKIKGEREGGGHKKQPLLQLKKQKQSRAVIE